MARFKKTFVAVVLCSSTVLGDLIGIPTVPFAVGNGTFDLGQIEEILIDPRYANATDTNGWTLIPPTLGQFAETFADDFASVTRKRVPTHSGNVPRKHSIFLTLDNSTEYQDAAARWTSEAYSLTVTKGGIVISGASPLGVWWGTRTLLQQASLRNGSLAAGTGVDSPGWNTRGIFLDAGRHYYPPSFIVEMCSWISYWKQNTFHLHLSDNLYNNVDVYSLERQMELYARFRLLSNDSAVAGLNLHPNESYTRQDFDDIQYGCAARGVTVIPEIEAPGHALVISQWKSQLALEGQIDLLNISHPDTIPTMETVWRTFLPWFYTKAVHIGADEYVDSQLSSDALAGVYNTFVNTMDQYIYNISGKATRIWGTFPPKANYTNNISTDVAVQHWEFFEDYPYQDYIQKGHSVINSDDHFYLVQKYSASYPNELNKTLIFYGNPLGGGFAPYIFDPNNATNNPPKENPLVPGHIAAQWNDYGYNTSTYLEAYYSWRDGLPALADKQWGGSLTEAQYDVIFETLQAAAPGQNLDRVVETKTSVILDYDLQGLPSASASAATEHKVVRDLSGNEYHGHTNCNVSKSNSSVVFENGCSLSTPLSSKGRNYTLSFHLTQHVDSPPGPLFTGPDSELRSGNGTSTQIMLVSAGNAFALNYSLPAGEWADATLIGRGNRTFFAVNGGEEMEFTTKLGVNGASFVWANMAVVAPLETVGGGKWRGEMRSIKLVDRVVCDLSPIILA
ncbi:hypothetical protein LTR08_006372 [Meristemomyces frigidus]|nr:hypothetical protein LTR08_006372 [Meristemomyces frigidus]